MSAQAQVVRLLVAANPVPDPDLLEPLDPVDHVLGWSRLTDSADIALIEVPLVTKPPGTDDDVTERDVGAGDRRRRPARIRLVAAGLVAAALVAALALVVRNRGESGPAVAPHAANGLIAFAGNLGDGSAQSDIYVVAPDGSGLRALTSTPELAEYAPTWSPDGSRLGFVRTDLPAIAHLRDCTPHCEFVVVDPMTGVETFSADVNDPAVGNGNWVPTGLAWSPDGRAIVVHSLACGYGGCTGGGAVIADLETDAITTFSGSDVMWSPDGEWLSVNDKPSSLLLVPADLIGKGDAVDVAELAGVRRLPESPGGGVEWMPDGSAMLFSESIPDAELIEHDGQAEAWIDLMTIADGKRRTLIEDGFDPVVSPDGSQIAYSHERAPAGLTDIWVAAADGSDPRRVTFSSTTPVWSPDGTLLLASDADGWFTVRPDGTGRTQITPFMLPDASDGCCPNYRPTWQPLAPGSSIGVVGAAHVRSRLEVVRTQGA